MRNSRTEFGKMQEESRVMERPILETEGGEHRVEVGQSLPHQSFQATKEARS